MELENSVVSPIKQYVKCPIDTDVTSEASSVSHNVDVLDEQRSHSEVQQSNVVDSEV